MSARCKEKAEVIAAGLWGQLDPTHLAKTGSLTQHHCFRSAKARSAFGWCSDVHNNRFFTDKAVREGIKLLFKRHDLKLPSVPGFVFKAWLESESKKIAELCRKARRSVASGSPGVAAAMDDMETQPYSFFNDDAEEKDAFANM